MYKMDASALEHRLGVERVRRIRELSNLRAVRTLIPEQLHACVDRSIIVLCYAHWEGYFNFCVDEYIRFVNESRLSLFDINASLVACNVERYFQSLRDRNQSQTAKLDLIKGVIESIEDSEVNAACQMPKAKSNLDFDRMSECFKFLEFSLDRFQSSRNFIQHQLVAWRHQVAHGDDPALPKDEILAHSVRVGDLLTALKEQFEDEVYKVEKRAREEDTHGRLDGLRRSEAVCNGHQIPGAGSTKEEDTHDSSQQPL